MTLPTYKPLDFIVPPAVAVEDSFWGANARPRGGVRERRESPPPTEAQLKAHTDYQSHATARNAAARRGEVRAISAVEVNTRRISAAEAAAQGASKADHTATITALKARIAAMERAQVEREAEYRELLGIARGLQERLAALEGSNPTGEAA